MSGGSHDYVYLRVEEMAHSILRCNPSPLRRAFAKHMLLVAKAMHDVEWVDSSDYGSGDDEAAMRAVLGDDAAKLVLRELRDEARRLMEEMAKWVTP